MKSVKMMLIHQVSLTWIIECNILDDIFALERMSRLLPYYGIACGAILRFENLYDLYVRFSWQGDGLGR